MQEVPQLWDLSSAAADRDDYELADEVAAAEIAGITLAHRLTGGVGQPVRLGLTDGVVLTGTLLAALSDGVVVADDAGPAIVPMPAIRTAETASTPRAPATSLGVRSEARRLVGATVSVLLSGGGTVGGRLHAVGADHLVVDRGTGRVVVPHWAVTMLRRR